MEGWLDRGYRRLHVPSHPRATPQGMIFEHILIAEKALGKPLLRQHPVHHHNEIRSDNRNSNLVICESLAYHKLLHQRMRILAAGGDPNLDKICCTCRSLKSLTEFYKDRR